MVVVAGQQKPMELGRGRWLMEAGEVTQIGRGGGGGGSGLASLALGRRWRDVGWQCGRWEGGGGWRERGRRGVRLRCGE